MWKNLTSPEEKFDAPDLHRPPFENTPFKRRVRSFFARVLPAVVFLVLFVFTSATRYETHRNRRRIKTHKKFDTNWGKGEIP